MELIQQKTITKTNISTKLFLKLCPTNRGLEQSYGPGDCRLVL